MSKSICTLNFDNVAQSVADILLRPVWVSKNKRPQYWNSTSDDWRFCRYQDDSASAYQISCKSDHRRPSCDVLEIFKLAATASEIYFRFPLWWRITIIRSTSSCTLKFDNVAQTNGRHIGILLPVSTLTFSSSSAMWFCVGTPNFMQIGPWAAELWRLSNFQDIDHIIGNLLPVSALVTYRNKECQNLFAH